MRILFLSENFPPETNAAATRVYERARYWADWGHQVTVVTSAPNFPQGKLHAGYENRWYQTETIDGIRVVRVKTYMAPNRGTVLRMLDFISFFVTGAAAAICQRRPDVVCATSPQFFAAVAGWVTGMIRRRPFVFELGDIWPASIVAVGAMRKNLPYRLMEAFELFLYRRSAAIVALTASFKRNLVGRGIPPGKIAVVMNGVDVARYGPQPRDRQLAEQWDIAGTFNIGYVGTHGMAHRLHNVLDAAARLRDRSDIRFVFAGDGAERADLIDRAQREGLTNAVFIPPQPKDAMPAVWSLCDVALVHLRNSPVFSEVVPSKIFEAMAMGLPLLLAAPGGEADKIVRRHDAGLCVAPEDPAALAEAARRLADDADLRQRLAANSLAAADAHSRRTQAVEMLQILEIAAAGWGDRAGLGRGSDTAPAAD
jgi:glycosyltransferase involved in cell wall biosynthesis